MSNDTEPTNIETILSGLTVAPAVAQYVEALNHAAVEYANKRGYAFVDKFTIVRLAKYVKVISSTLYVETGQLSNTHVHSFVDPTTGGVYKPAGWKAPAKGERYNLSTPEGLDRLIAALDPTGRYLYIR